MMKRWISKTCWLCSMLLTASLMEAQAPERDAFLLLPNETAAVAVPSSGSSILILVGFLALIVALLLHWSRDTSCRRERSVFSR